MCQSSYIGLDTLYCGKWRKLSKSHYDLDLDRTMPNVELIRTISYITICSVSRGLNHFFFELSCTQCQTDKHTDGHEYSIVVADKLQLQ